MALLNFAKTYAEIEGKISLTEATTGDYVKLFFSKDGHIITHGKDFLATFTAAERGLVPKSGGDVKKVLRGNATWAAITTDDLPIGPVSNNVTTIPTSLQVQLYVDLAFTANDAMRYKGTLSYEDGKYYTATEKGRVEGFPTKCEVGDTYKVEKEGNYGGLACNIGDTLICVKDGEVKEEVTNLNTLEYWNVVQSNIEGIAYHSVNNNTIPTYTSNPTTIFTIFAPDTGGTAGLVLVSNGNAKPGWQSPSNLTAGKVSLALSAGVGLSFGSDVTYDGGVARTIKLIPTAGSTIGGVSIDKNAEADKKTITVDADGNIHLTQLNIINALGDISGNVINNKAYKTIITNSATSTTAADGNFINLVLTTGSSAIVTGSTLIAGNGNISVNGTASTLLIGLNAADASNYGGIKIGYTPNNRNYAVQLDSNGKAFVNVPGYNLASTTADGLVPKFDALGNGSLDSNSWILAKLNNGTYDWFKLPSSVFGDNWRPITIDGISIGNKTLNFKPIEDSLYMYLDTSNAEDNVYDLGFGLCWYNISLNDGRGGIEIP